MTGEEHQSVRQRKQAATALTIERSAVALVLDHGIDHVTVDMICEAAGVSQRTFFNYFKTKDAAILGATPPQLEERRVREFLASDNPNLLADLLELLVSLAPVDTTDLALAGARMRIISGTPQLMRKEMERLFAFRAELEEVLYLRMRRSAPATETEAGTREQAALITHVMAGVMRFSIEESGTPGRGLEPSRIQHLLTAVLARLT